MAYLNSFERFYAHMIETHFNQSHIFSKKSLELTFYLFATSYILLQASAYNLGKKYLFYDYHLVYLYFGYSVRYINVNSFQIPLFFCVLFSSPVNKAELTLATQSGSNYLKSTAEGPSFQILVVPNASKTFDTLFPYYH